MPPVRRRKRATVGAKKRVGKGILSFLKPLIKIIAPSLIGEAGKWATGKVAGMGRKKKRVVRRRKGKSVRARLGKSVRN